VRTGGEWVVEVLRAQGVRHVFGLPGVHNLAIYDALIRQHDIAHILSRHEQHSVAAIIGVRDGLLRHAKFGALLRSQSEALGHIGFVIDVGHGFTSF
jgi:TPP-dependent 2-oxoacid decarboxylase